MKNFLPLLINSFFKLIMYRLLIRPAKKRDFISEAGGFEPPMPCGILAFQASALDHYATPPQILYGTFRANCSK